MRVYLQKRWVSVLRCSLLGALRSIGLSMMLSMMNLWSVVWKHLRNANHAVDQEGQSYNRRDYDGDYFVYSVCGWGVTSDCTIVVSVDESLD